MNLLLAALATLRLTRFVTTDTLGEWWLVGPARRWAGRYESQEIRRRQNAERSEMRRKEHAGIRVTYASQDGQTSVSPEEFVTQNYDENDPWTWQAKLVKGLDCPFCVGFWIGVAVLLSLTLVRAVPPLLPLWRIVVGTFALNYVVGHISSRIDG